MARSPRLRFAGVLHRSALILVLIVLAGCGRKQDLVTGPGSEAVSTQETAPASVRSLPADERAPDIASTMAVQDRHTLALLVRPGVIGTGTSIDAAGRPIIVVYTERASVAGIPRSLDGIPTRVHFAGKVIPYAKPGSGTLQMGTSTGNDLECAAGTLGCVVVKGGVQYFLSNNHVFARENDGSNGERIDAPGRYDGHPICAQTPQCANLSDFEPIRFGQNNTIDAAIAQPIASRAYTCATSSGYTPSSAVVSPSVGLAVKKTGRTSRLTTGTIQAINVTIQVQYSGGVARFVNQIQTPGNFIRSGDSGSLMVTQSGNNPVGLCFAGGSGASFANPIGAVLQRFAATVCSQ